MTTPYFERDDVALFLGDAVELLPVLGLRFDLVLTDVPYSPSTHDGARTNARGEAAAAGLRGKRLIDFKHFDERRLLEFFDVVGRFAERWVVSTVDVKHTHALQDHPPASLRFVRRGLWIKTNPTPQLTGDRPGQGFEDIAILHAAAQRRLVWNGGGRAALFRHVSDVDAAALRCAAHALAELVGDDADRSRLSAREALLARAIDLLSDEGEVAVELPGVRKSKYPTEKPIALGRQLVKLFSAPGDLVLDPACGAGTFLRAARQLGRTAIGIDVDEEALEVAATLLDSAPASDACDPLELRELPVRKRSLLHERAGLPVEVHVDA